MLVACEFSGIVRDAFKEKGHDAWSCDLLPTERPGNHIQDDVLKHLDEGWDLMIAHPPCTYLTNAGVRHLHSHVQSVNGKKAKVNGEARWQAMREAAEFFNALWKCSIPMICVENPVPHRYAREIIGRYTQRIQPWQFGHGEIKRTCFWLKCLPPLQPTHRRDDLFCEQEPADRVTRAHFESPGPDRWKNRSRTFPGIAKAMADQWGTTL